MSTIPPIIPLDEKTRLAIAEYTLGTLYGDEENKTRDLINSNDEAVHLALHWETVLLAMADRLPPVSAEPLVLARVQRTLGLPRIDPEVQPLWRPETPASTVSTTVKVHTPPAHTKADARKHTEHVVPTAPEPSIEPARPASSEIESLSPVTAEPIRRQASRSAWYTRPAGVMAIAAVAAISLLTFTLLRQNPTPAEATQAVQTRTESKPADPLFISILQPPKSTSTPGWILVQKTPGQLRADPRLQSQRAANQGLALWTRQSDSPETRFLGWVSDSSVNDIRLPEGFVLSEDTLFEITLEKQDIDTTRPPDGAVLFIGQAVKTTLPDPLPPIAAPQAPLR